jgi:hypothetical protein
MTVTTRKFARFYYDDFITEFPEAYIDDSMLATWLRLLVVAERNWPATPELPRSVRPRPLAKLVDAELVELVQPHCFRIRGLDAERARRAASARTGAAKRWQSDGNANASANAMPRRERDENENETREIPPPPAKRGRRKDATNPREEGTSPRLNHRNPRANGTSPRQERDAEKRAGFPQSIHDILAKVNSR